MVYAEALPTIRDQPLDDSETRVLEIVEEGVEGEIARGGEAELGLPRGFDISTLGELGPPLSNLLKTDSAPLIDILPVSNSQDHDLISFKVKDNSVIAYPEPVRTEYRLSQLLRMP